MLGLAISASAQMALDLDTEKGDQAVREAKATKTGDIVTVQLVSTVPVQDLVGVEVDIKFDSGVAFKGFKAEGLLRGAMPLPRPVPGGVNIAVAIMGSRALLTSRQLWES